MTITQIKSSNLYPVLILTFLAIIWGSSFILIKKGLLAYSPVQVGTLRIIFACIVLLPIAVKNLKTSSLPIGKNYLYLAQLPILHQQYFLLWRKQI